LRVDDIRGIHIGSSVGQFEVPGDLAADHLRRKEYLMERIGQRLAAEHPGRVGGQIGVGGGLGARHPPADTADGTAADEGVAVDGKTLRGAVDTDGRRVHLLAALHQQQSTVLAQRRVDGKSNEITGFRPLLEEVDLEGRVVTADALHCQRDHARYLVGERHADYLFVAKENQPGLVAAISQLPEQAFSPSERDR